MREGPGAPREAKGPGHGSLQLSAVQPSGNLGGGQPQLKGLAAADHAVLPLGQPGDCLVCSTHVSSKAFGTDKIGLFRAGRPKIVRGVNDPYAPGCKIVHTSHDLGGAPATAALVDREAGR